MKILPVAFTVSECFRSLFKNSPRGWISGLYGYRYSVPYLPGYPAYMDTGIRCLPGYPAYMDTGIRYLPGYPANMDTGIQYLPRYPAYMDTSILYLPGYMYDASEVETN